MGTPEVLRNRDFVFYWAGVVFSQVGTRGTLAATLYQVYDLTGSTARTGLVGLAQAVALLVLSPMGGVYADRLDRRRLLQRAQGVAMVVALGLAALTFTGDVTAWEVLLAVLLTTAAATFDQSARQALIPALVPRRQLPQAIALINPSREAAVLIGPALSGVLIAVSGPGLMYAVDAGTYATLVVALGILRVPPLHSDKPHPPFWESLVEGAKYVRHRRLIWMVMGVDLSATLFGSFRAVLPALSKNVLGLGPTGYGLLSSTPSAGALLATYLVFRVVGSARRLGRTLLLATVGYGVAIVLLGQSHWAVIAFAAALLAGGCDAMATTIRQAAVQLDTPDELRGRVTSIYQMSSRGGPALGDTIMGGLAGAAGPAAALTTGGVVATACAVGVLSRPNPVRSYGGASQEPAHA